MQEIKDTQRAEVRIGFDGRVHKKYKGQLAKERYENEVRVLKYLEAKGCEFVPKLLEEHPEQLYIVTTNCGAIVQKMSPEKEKAVFDELESYGVRHDDAFMRNITYSAHIGRFCVIDFEFAVILESGQGLTIKEAEEAREGDYERKGDD
ncbi:serine/threonine protein phosphatase [Pelagicoccus mobilis]|uniref:Serine/threonine protein phosphatase n=1 Tax=Pelagicoccus mobilis TaxID=415221 RepID=A0A934VN25_9BACT|nr:serine/threonine protein phosphatase [Pelagicoccus mobilis]MBK1879471.1 serine/threonine protein phosphatase [Pelagicoccus mobilis]